MGDLVVYKKLRWGDCLKMPSGWGKIAWCSYASFKKRAQNEDPPGYGTLMTCIIQGVHARDRSFIDKGVELAEKHVGRECALCFSGMALCDIGELQDGLAQLRKAVKIEPSIRNMLALAGQLEEPEDFDEKKMLCEKLLQQDPDDADALRGFAFVLIHQNRCDEAEPYIARGLKAAPRNSGLREAHAELLYQRGNYTAALREYRRAMSWPFNSRATYFWHRIACCYDRVGQPKKAKKAARKMVKAACRERLSEDQEASIKELVDYLGVPADKQ